MSYRDRRRLIGLIAGCAAFLLPASALLLFLRTAMVRPHPVPQSPATPCVSFQWSSNQLQLKVLASKTPKPKAECRSCHAEPGTLSRPSSNRLSRLYALNQEAWATEIQLSAKCGLCHTVPDPSDLCRQSWAEAIEHMQRIMERKHLTSLSTNDIQDILHFYLAFSPEQHPLLPQDPSPSASPIKFEGSTLGNPVDPNSWERPFVGHVEVTDLDKDGRPDVLVSDSRKSIVSWIHNQHGLWQEDTLAQLPNPAHTRAVTNESSGNVDILVACMGIIGPSDAPKGSVVLLVNEGNQRFAPIKLLDNISRLADAEAGDFDGDGDVDFIIAAYGYVNEGEVGWLENLGANKYIYHLILKKTGPINVLPIDLNQDHHLDFVALFAQEHEEICAFINDGKGGFQEHLLFKATTPCYGSSGIQLVDLDQDGDTDILYTNGDNMDLPSIVPRPYHGVQWLENKGNLEFVWHDIFRCYGAYSATAGDLNGDGSLDIVVSTLFNDWSDPKRASIVWLQNDGHQRFTPHAIARKPTHLISCALGDMDRDGLVDVIACGMHSFSPFDRVGRVTLWRNRGAPSVWDKIFDVFPVAEAE